MLERGVHREGKALFMIGVCGACACRGSSPISVGGVYASDGPLMPQGMVGRHNGLGGFGQGSRTCRLHSG